MLPDFPALKLELHEREMRRFRGEVNSQMPMVSKLRSVQFHEGDYFAFQRHDGVIQKQSFTHVERQVIISAQLEFEPTLGSLQEQKRAIASDFAATLEHALLETIECVSKEVGNTMDFQGAPFSAERYLDAFEKIDIDFDFFGVPKLPMVVVHPSMRDAIGRELRRIETELRLRDRANDLLKRKHEDWLDRESSRRLVD